MPKGPNGQKRPACTASAAVVVAKLLLARSRILGRQVAEKVV